MKNQILFCFVLMVGLASFISCVTPAPSAPIPQVASSATPMATTLSQGQVPGFKPEWTAQINSMMTDGLFLKFDQGAEDMVRFCPKYKILSPEAKIMAIEFLLSAIVKFESDYNPADVYPESDGSVSRGLFQLTYGNAFCPKSKQEGDLNDPVVNIKCGVQIAASLIGRDLIVSGGGYISHGAPPPKGLARYWSVIRVPDTKSKHHLIDIQAMTAKAPGCQ